MQKFIFILLVLICCGSINATEKSAQKNIYSEEYGKTETYKRVWHDGYWWIEVYNDDGDFVYQYIDPVQI